MRHPLDAFPFRRLFPPSSFSPISSFLFFFFHHCGVFSIYKVSRDCIFEKTIFGEKRTQPEEILLLLLLFTSCALTTFSRFPRRNIRKSRRRRSLSFLLLLPFPPSLPSFIPVLRPFLSPSSFPFSRNTGLHYIQRKQRIRTSAEYAADTRKLRARARGRALMSVSSNISPLNLSCCNMYRLQFSRGTLPERRAPRARGLPL